MPQLYLNNFITQFIAAVKAAPETPAPASELDYGIVRVSDGAAGALLNPQAGDWYVLTAFKRSGTAETQHEILRITNVDNSVVGECRLTVLRGQEGTAPQAFAAGDYLELRLTAGAMDQYAQSSDPRMTDPRVPKGAAGGVLAGQFPNPAFAQAMATAADLAGKVDKVAGKGLSANDFTNAAAAKLAGVEEQATKNATDAQLRDRATHTGTQAIGTVAGLQGALDGKAPLASPAFAGTPTATTPATTAQAGEIATAGFVWSLFKEIAGFAGPAINNGASNLNDAPLGSFLYMVGNAGNVSTNNWPPVVAGPSNITLNVLTFGTGNGRAQIGATQVGPVCKLWFRLRSSSSWENWQEVGTAAAISNLNTAVNNKVDKDGAKQLSAEDYTTAEKNKLAAIAAGATANDTDANLKNRANHTGTQPISSVTLLQENLNGLGGEISELRDDLTIKAYIDTPEFSGVPKAPTAAVGTNTNQLATTAFVQNERKPKFDSHQNTTTLTPSWAKDFFVVYELVNALTIANPTGTAIEGLGFVIRIKDWGTAQGITWGNQYVRIGGTLPTTTKAGKTMYIGCIWNAITSKVDVISIVEAA